MLECCFKKQNSIREHSEDAQDFHPLFLHLKIGGVRSSNHCLHNGVVRPRSALHQCRSVHMANGEDLPVRLPYGYSWSGWKYSVRLHNIICCRSRIQVFDPRETARLTQTMTWIERDGLKRHLVAVASNALEWVIGQSRNL